MGLTAAVARIQVLAGAMSGVRLAPNYPPDQANAFPFVITYSETGTILSARLGNVLTDGTHQIATEIHVARRDLPTAIELAQPYLALFITALQSDPTLNGSIIEIQQLSYSFDAMTYGGVDTIGYRFLTQVNTDEC